MAKAKQGALAGMEPETIPDLEQASENYVEARNAWQRAKVPMDEAYAILEAKMKEHKKKKYEYDGKLVEFVPGQVRIKVRSTKKAEPEEDDEDGSDEE